MALKIEQLWHRTKHEPLQTFFVRNAANKIVAIGILSAPNDPGFVFMKANRYERDADLVRAVERLTGMRIRRYCTK